MEGVKHLLQLPQVPSTRLDNRQPKPDQYRRCLVCFRSPNGALLFSCPYPRVSFTSLALEEAEAGTEAESLVVSQQPLWVSASIRQEDRQEMTRSAVFKSGLGALAVLAGGAIVYSWRPLQITVVSPATEENKGPSDSRQESSKVKLCPMPAFVSSEAFMAYEKQKQYVCKKLEYFGVGDGSKGVCMDPVFGLDKNNCKVFSFGISQDWTFDDAFGVFGCKVYSFDPTIGKEDHQHAPNVKFFNLGISNKEDKARKRDTYENILKRLGLLDSVIDYLKMDVELAELSFFDDVFNNTPHLLTNIKQIGMETHYGGKGLKERFWDYYHRLACYGFKVMDARQYGGRTEIVWGRP